QGGKLDPARHRQGRFQPAGRLAARQYPRQGLAAPDRRAADGSDWSPARRLGVQGASAPALYRRGLSTLILFIQNKYLDKHPVPVSHAAFGLASGLPKRDVGDDLL